jgi:succinate-semialdehyde dehydrogenase/glutarate-semialdehyde dehydrogenase
MELGGKDPMVVCDDADIEVASAGAVWAGLSNCGQMCSSVERIYVARPAYDAFVAAVVARVKALRVGPDTGDYDVEIGPMANEEQLATVVEHVRDALAKGARVLTGGRRPDRPGFFFEPTVLVDVNHTMKVMKEETFGPILPIMPVDSDDEAVMLANDSEYGLTASVWTRDKARGEAVAHRLLAGTVTVNDHAYTYAVCETPWQGMKSSGVGRSHSDAGLLEFVYPKHVNVDHSPSFSKRRVWWFPYGRPAYEVQKLAIKAFASVRELPRLVAAVLTRKDYRKALM